MLPSLTQSSDTVPEAAATTVSSRWYAKWAELRELTPFTCATAACAVVRLPALGTAMVTVQVMRLASPEGSAPDTERMVPFSTSKVVSGMTCAA